MRLLVYIIGVLAFMMIAFVGLPLSPAHAQFFSPYQFAQPQHYTPQLPPPIVIQPPPHPVNSQLVVVLPRPPAPQYPTVPSCIPQETLFGPICHPILSFLFRPVP